MNDKMKRTLIFGGGLILLLLVVTASSFAYFTANITGEEDKETITVTNMGNMFYGSQATTDYARTLVDANKFNASSEKPAGLTFVVK